MIEQKTADCILLWRIWNEVPPVLWLLVGRQEEHPACKYWCGYLSGARNRLFAYGPADAIAIPKPHHLLPHLNSDWF